MGSGIVIRRSARPCVVSAATGIDLSPSAGQVNSLWDDALLLGSKIAVSRFYYRERSRQLGEAEMAKRPVVTRTEARAGTKEGVVRYILLASLVLVVVLFVVAYEL